MRLEEVIERFCSRPLVEREQVGNAESLAGPDCSRRYRCSQPDVVNIVLKCDACEYFVPDQIGDGSGIGQCGQGVEWTQEKRGRRPLFRYASRHCDSFRQKLTDDFPVNIRE